MSRRRVILKPGEQLGENSPFDSRYHLRDGLWVCPAITPERPVEPYPDMPSEQNRLEHLQARSEQLRQDVEWYLGRCRRPIFLQMLRKAGERIRSGIRRYALVRRCDELPGGKGYVELGDGETLRDTGVSLCRGDTWLDFVGSYVDPNWLSGYVGADRWEQRVLAFAQEAYRKVLETVVEAYWRRWGKHLYWGVGKHLLYCEDNGPIFDTWPIASDLGVMDLADRYVELPMFCVNTTLDRILKLEARYQKADLSCPEFTFLDGGIGYPLLPMTEEEVCAS